MLCWESKRRLRSLRNFRQLVTTYFENTAISNMGRPVEQAEASAARDQINLMATISSNLARIGHTMSMKYTPPPLTGLPGFRINVVNSLFGFDRLRIPRKVMLDYLDRAIGDYERLNKKMVLAVVQSLLLALAWLRHSTSFPLSLTRRRRIQRAGTGTILAWQALQIHWSSCRSSRHSAQFGFSTAWQDLRRLFWIHHP